jgi:hypothetical protein
MNKKQIEKIVNTDETLYTNYRKNRFKERLKEFCEKYNLPLKDIDDYYILTSVSTRAKLKDNEFILVRTSGWYSDIILGFKSKKFDKLSEEQKIELTSKYIHKLCRL